MKLLSNRFRRAARLYAVACVPKSRAAAVDRARRRALRRAWMGAIGANLP